MLVCKILKWINRHCVCARNSIIFLFSLTLTLPLPTSITNEHLLYCASNLILRNKFIWSMVSTVKGLAKGIERVWTEENEWCCCCYSATFGHITVYYVSRQFIQCFSSITISFHFNYLCVLCWKLCVVRRALKRKWKYCVNQLELQYTLRMYHIII